jgi:hypothetical protein
MSSNLSFIVSKLSFRTVGNVVAVSCLWDASSWMKLIYRIKSVSDIPSIVFLRIQVDFGRFSSYEDITHLFAKILELFWYLTDVQRQQQTLGSDMH